MKRGFALFALIGLLGCFLPLLPGLSLFELRQVDAIEVYLMLAGFTVPLILALGDKMTPGTSTIVVVCFGYVLWTFGIGGIWDLLVHSSLGGKAIAIGAIGGLVTGLGSFADDRA